jgi:hypothetical protein
MYLIDYFCFSTELIIYSLHRYKGLFLLFNHIRKPQITPDGAMRFLRYIK